MRIIIWFQYTQLYRVARCLSTELFNSVCLSHRSTALVRLVTSVCVTWPSCEVNIRLIRDREKGLWRWGKRIPIASCGGSRVSGCLWPQADDTSCLLPHGTQQIRLSRFQGFTWSNTTAVTTTWLSSARNATGSSVSREEVYLSVSLFGYIEYENNTTELYYS